MDAAEAEFGRPGRLTVLPNSLFVEQQTRPNLNEIEEEEDGFDEHGAYDESDHLFAGGTMMDIEPGDLIWLNPVTRGVRAQLAIYLGVNDAQHQFFLSDGRWVTETLSPQLSPKVRRFAPMEELQQIKKHLPVKSVERPLHNLENMTRSEGFAADVPQADAEPLLRRLLPILDDMSTFRRKNLDLLDSAYVRLAHDDKFVSMNFEEVVSKLLSMDYSEASPASLMAIFSSLPKKFPTLVQYIKAPYYSLANVLITPKRLAKQHETVCGWAREYQESAAEAAMGKDVAADLARNPLTEFIEKARRLILKSRAHRSPTTTGALGPSSVHCVEGDRIAEEDGGESFSENDKMFVEFIWDCYVRRPAMTTNQYHSIGSLILRAIGAYPKLPLQRPVGSLLLQELGTVTPWSSIVDHNVTYQIPGGRGFEELDALCAETDRLCEEMGLTENPNHTLLTDSMASLRQDLGDLAVYTLDPLGTRVKDDGFSIQANPDIPGTYWIHGHIAHPAAFIEPDHPFAQRARALLHTIMHNDKIVRLMPLPFLEALSLQANGPALTISTLLSEDGEVLSRKIVPSILRNVIELDKRAVAMVIGRPIDEEASMVLGKTADRLKPASHNPEEDVRPADLAKARKYRSDLQLMDRLLQARLKTRRAQVADPPNWKVEDSTLSTVSVASFGHGTDDEARLLRSQYYQGDPTISLRARRYPKFTPLFELQQRLDLATNCMELATESAGEWFRERGIPGCFFGCQYQEGFPASRLNAIDRNESRKYPVTRISSTPAPHVMLCKPSHLLWTSPLRRYPDLLAHWQINAFLQAEARGVQLNGDGSGDGLPFTKAMVDHFLAHDISRLWLWVRYVSKMTKDHWVFQALFRAFHFKEIDLPEVWDFRVTKAVYPNGSADDTGLRGSVLPFFAFAGLLASEQGWERSVRRYSTLPVKIELVDMAGRMVLCRAVGPPSDSLSCTDPIQLAPKSDGPHQTEATASG